MRLRLASDLDALIERARIERLLDHLHWPWDAGLGRFDMSNMTPPTGKERHWPE